MIRDHHAEEIQGWPLVTLECSQGHRPGFRMCPDRTCGVFATGEAVDRVSRDSHAYAHGGCCFRAAQDALAGRDVFHEAS